MLEYVLKKPFPAKIGFSKAKTRNNFSLDYIFILGTVFGI